MAALASLRCNSKLKAFYDRLIQKHKPAKVALVAVMRKLLSFMHALFKNNSFWGTSMEFFTFLLTSITDARGTII